MSQEHGSQQASPSITALFLVVFDQKIGYKIAWQRSLDSVQLDGVEYKSLPSGLHNVQQDLIYFTQDQHAGLSAFVRRAAGSSDRNARFAAVGVYVPLSHGRLGKAWLHSQGLRELAEGCIDNLDNHDMLEEYWNTHKPEGSASAASPQKEASADISKPSSAGTVNRNNVNLSLTGSIRPAEPVLSPDHPALAIHEFLDTFGPLVFPLYRAALLRKRILLLGSPPVRQMCNFVYILSILSNIPPALLESLPDEAASARMKPLFNVGIHDITDLKNEPSDGLNGWVACSTDDILATKRDLFDVIVKLSPTAEEWPKIMTNDDKMLLATQRDLRRYNALRKELVRMRRRQSWNTRYRDDEDDFLGAESDEDQQPLMRSVTSLAHENEQLDVPELENESAITEPPSWAAIAYSSFLWWASAGERSAARDEESEQDASLVEDLVSTTAAASTPNTPNAGTTRRRNSSARRKKRSSTTSLSRLISGASSDHEDERPMTTVESQQESTVLIAYFHRLTTMLMSGVADILDLQDENSPDGSEELIQLNAEEVSRLGLDIWSEADSRFISDLGWLWWDKEIRWNGRGIELCGVKIC